MRKVHTCLAVAMLIAGALLPASAGPGSVEQTVREFIPRVIEQVPGLRKRIEEVADSERKDRLRASLASAQGWCAEMDRLLAAPTDGYGRFRLGILFMACRGTLKAIDEGLPPAKPDGIDPDPGTDGT